MPLSNMMSQNILSPAEIAGKKFEKARMGGYRPTDVDTFLDEVASSVSAMSREFSELKKKLDAADRKISEMQNDEVSLSQALLNAQRLADNILKDAREKAELTIRDAEIKADNIRGKATSAIDGQKEELLKAQRETAAFKRLILDMYKRQVEMILKIPDNEEKRDAGNVEVPEFAVPAKTPAAASSPASPPAAAPAVAEKPNGLESPQADSKPFAAEKPEEKPGRELNIRFKEAAAAAVARPQVERQQEAAPELPRKPLEQQPAEKPEEKKAEKPKFKLNLKYDEQSGEYIPVSQDKN